MRVLLLLLFISFLIISCGIKKTDTKKVATTYNIDIRNALDQKEKQLLLSDFAKKLKYIPLETNKSCLLKRANYIKMNSNYLFVSDAKVLYQFDLTGKFIREIGSVGKGPMDHGRRIKFNIDTLNNEILIFSYHPIKMNVYDIKTGKFKRNIKINFEVANFELFPKNRITLFTTEFGLKKASFKMLNEAYLTDRDGNKTDSITDYNRLNNHNNIAGYIHLYNDGKQLCYMGNYKDTLFHLNEHFQKSPYISFNLDNEIEWNELIINPAEMEKLADFTTVGRISETHNYIFLTIRVGIRIAFDMDAINMLYIKKSNKLITTKGLTNDLDGGMTFWPILSVNQKLVTFYHPSEILEYAETIKDRTKLSDEYLKLISGLNEEDNPVIVIME